MQADLQDGKCDILEAACKDTKYVNRTLRKDVVSSKRLMHSCQNAAPPGRLTLKERGWHNGLVTRNTVLTGKATLKVCLMPKALKYTLNA